ncbi:hypothetical protein [Endozoicomonas euniceicola]|uniref:SpoVT-AbrB domain-containing protein n=1 Tax=Endozoicomonas euniceicola TaxID=1234143 RepID=A0ABY6H0H7_9GAMM|nr:hypothetical protein [Endozoicomonas euniceicola]UYM18552.1 hypothetical protein NX720_11825 [Endozoicomonas euniceicola]
MLHTYKATIDQKGNLQLPENIVLPSGSQVLITVLDKPLPDTVNDEALLSEQALAEDWNKPEEDKAWESLQQEQ